MFPGSSNSKEYAHNVGDPSLIPGSGPFPGEGNATHSSILAWRSPRTEEPGGLQFRAHKGSDTSEWLRHAEESYNSWLHTMCEISKSGFEIGQKSYRRGRVGSETENLRKYQQRCTFWGRSVYLEMKNWILYL